MTKIKPITILLLISTMLCVLIVGLRVYLSSSIYYTFFLWNLFLAWIPLLLSNSILKMRKRGRSTLSVSIVFIIWLIFFPNAPYIITDLFHLRQIQNIPLWFDLILIMSFAWNGLMIGYLSLLKIQSFLDSIFHSTTSWIIIVSILFLSAFGIYLGRYERWNSWDIVTNPFALMTTIVDKIINPFANPQTIGVTVFFSTFLISTYTTLFYLIKSRPYEN